ISCKHSGAWKLAVRGTLLPAFWKVTNQLPVDVAVGDDVTWVAQLPMELSNIVAACFPLLCHCFEVGIEPRLALGWLLFGKGTIPLPSRDGRMAYPHLSSNGRLREALLAQSHNLLVLSQALFSLRLTLLCMFWILF